MAVQLTIAETINGIDYADALSGGETGIDYGQATNGAFTPLVAPQSANTGAQEVWLRHDAINDPIEDLAVHISQYSGAYGGAKTAALDYTGMKNRGFSSSGSDPANLDGNSAGLHSEMDWDISVANQFQPSRIGSGGGGGNNVFIFGDGAGSSTDGIDLSSAFVVVSDAMARNNGGVPAAPSAPVDGKVAVNAQAADPGNNATEIGDRARILYRVYLKSSETEGGITQWDTVPILHKGI